MGFELMVAKGAQAGRRYSVPDNSLITVGSGRGADILFELPGLASLHCGIECCNGSLFIWDMGSDAGTKVNGETLTGQFQLEAGDNIQAGQMHLLVIPSGSGPPISLGAEEVKTVVAKAAPEEGRREGDEDTVDLRTAPGPGFSIQNFDDGRPLSTRSLDLNTWGGDGELTPEMIRLRDHLQGIFILTNRLQRQFQLSGVIEAATKTIFDVVQAENAAMILVDGAKGELGVPCCLSRSGGGVRRAFSQSVVREALGKGVIVFTNNAGSDDRFLETSILTNDISCVICVPIESNGKIIGAFYVDRRGIGAGGGFTDLELAVMSSLSHQAGIAIERSRLVDDLRLLFIGTIHAIIRALEARDAYTRGHSERVAIYSLAMADKLRWTQDRRDLVELSALLHDVGKVGISESILNKAGRLTDEEFAIVKTHPGVGSDILAQLPNLHRLVSVDEMIDVVRHHHEWINGRGYPDSLRGAEIPIQSRLIAIADSYDAICTNRPYRKGTPEEALDIMRGELGSHFDRELFPMFEELIRRGLNDRLAEVPTRFNVNLDTVGKLSSRGGGPP
ncbi:MAG: HD domain-containing protein [Planctomycetota bacterium]|jgi:HD-GYP domain-containing protein (c-di-GMP phosphodiesterase class II)|nr:HD domain-containing protein [Planctomycetota bacterium]